MGCSKPIVGLVIPAGFSFNMDGTAIYMTMGVLFIAQACNIDLTLSQQFGILMIMLFTSKGAAGVTGGGFIALAATMPAVHALPIGGLALLVGIDRFMAEIRAASNLTGNAVATVVIAAWEKELDWDKAAQALDGNALVAEEPEKVHEIQTEHVPA
jgi:Na+/H+-dicarboxylate symporter